MNIEAVCVFQESKIKGYVLFNEDKVKKQTKITIHLKNVPLGKHGFHIHSSGDLREGCKSLCAHFNPYNKTHGGPNDKIRHVGDLGNIEPNSKGIVKKVMYDKLIKLSGKNSIIGRSVVIHSGEDDLGRGGNEESLITGNAGSRIACGIIGYSKNTC
jgi:Cu-Zn family superoxide dismutase